jgi:glutathione S-transferase
MTRRHRQCADAGITRRLQRPKPATRRNPTPCPKDDRTMSLNPALDADYAFIRDAQRRQLAPQAFRRMDPESEATAPVAPKHQVADQQEQLLFWDFPASPFCVKLRAILNWKGLHFEAVDPLQGTRWLRLQRRGPGKVPALEIDGRFVTDSTDIAHELERLYPERPVIPADPRHRAACHMLEEWADEGLYFIGLYYQWLHADSGRHAAALFGRDLLGRLACRTYRRRIHAQVLGQGTGRKSPAHIESDLERHLLAAERMLEGRRFLLGDEPLLCDFALFGQLTLLLRAPAASGFIHQRPSLLRYVDRLRILAR